MTDSVAGSPAVDETDLVRRLQARESTAFEEIVRAYGGRLLAVARRMLASDEDARDAVQEAFLSAFRAIDGFGGDARVSTWLHRIVVNVALMRLRTRRRRPETPIEALLPAFRDDGHHDEQFRSWVVPADGLVLQAETRELVRAAIDRLADAYRTVLLLRDIEERTTNEVAGLLGVTPNAVKIRLHRARQALRTLLDAHFRSPDS